MACRSPLPMLRATTTLVPMAKPANTFRIRLISEPVVPMAPIAPSTSDMPTMIMSAAE